MSGKHADPTAKKNNANSASDEPKIIGERRAAIALERKPASSANKVATEPIRNKERRVAKVQSTKKKRRLVDWILTVVAELFIIVAVMAGLFLLWKFVINDAITAANQSSSADALIDEFNADTTVESLDYDPQDPPVMDGSKLKLGEQYGVIYIPRLDPNYKRVLAQGTTTDILWAQNAGVGHYVNTQMPGGYGNYALAGHRNTVFKNLKTIVPGDRIYIQTKDGYYTYEVKEEHIFVKPNAIEVIAPIPGNNESTVEDAELDDSRMLTLTTCWPEWSNTERLIVHAEFVEWRPLAAGAPAEIAAAAS